MAKRLETNLREGSKVDLIRVRTERRARCTVGEQIGVGGSAKVYAGTLDEDGSQVVLKCQRYSGPLDPALELEIGILKRLNHRNVVPCVGMGATRHGQIVLGFRRCYPNPMFSMAKEHVASEIKRDKDAVYPHLPLDTAIDLTYELLRALRYLEQQRLVHHDVKLANLLIDPGPLDRRLGGRDVMSLVARREYRAVLIDFGATRDYAELDAFNKGEAGAPPPQVTPLYAPPEAVVERRREDGSLGRLVDPSIDIYAAALVTYAMVTGHPPYSHLRELEVDVQDLESLVNAKSIEGRGEIEPISHDVIRRVVHEGLRFKHDKSAFDLALFEFLRPRLSPDPAERGSMADMLRDFVKVARIDDRRRAEAADLEGGKAKKKARVHLPFSQELVEVSTAGEHPLTSAARIYGVTAEFDRDAIRKAAGVLDPAQPAPPAGPFRDRASGLVFTDELPGSGPRKRPGSRSNEETKEMDRPEGGELKTQALDKEQLERSLQEARERAEQRDSDDDRPPAPAPATRQRPTEPPKEPKIVFGGSPGGLMARYLARIVVVALGVPTLLLALSAAAPADPTGSVATILAQLHALFGGPADWAPVAPLWAQVEAPLLGAPPLVLWIAWALLLLVGMKLTSSIALYRLANTRVFERPLEHKPGLGLVPLAIDGALLVLTLGVAGPWVALRGKRRTYQSFWAPSGASLDFQGSGVDVLKLSLLTVALLPLVVVTLGFAGLPLAFLWQRWEQEQMVVPDTYGKAHEVAFAGQLGDYVKHAAVGWLASVLSLGLLRPWAVVRNWRWLDRHSVV